MANHNNVADNLHTVRARIAAAAAQFHQNPDRIALLCVSKTFPAQDVESAIAAGATDFGENYVQEGVEKINALQRYRHDIRWHFIGPLQSNKTRDVAETFDWMHSVDREKIAHRLSEQRPVTMKPLQICIQVNVSGEDSKSGVNPKEAGALALAVSSMPRLTLRGLMAIPEPTDDIALQRVRFAQLTKLFTEIRSTLPSSAKESFDTLSMGMSADLESAIAESIPEATTMVRIGTALFGARPARA